MRIELADTFPSSETILRAVNVKKVFGRGDTAVTAVKNINLDITRGSMVALKGRSGSGKTTLGKELASHLMVEFVDLDAEIERVEQRTISDIFKQEGEEYFRLLEAKLLRDWAGGNKDFIMATGGGAP